MSYENTENDSMESDDSSESWQSVLAALMAESQKKSPVNFTKLAGSLNAAFDEIGGLPNTIVRLIKSDEVAPSTKAQLARLSMEIYYRALEQQPPGLTPDNLTPEQLLAVMTHVTDELKRRKSAGPVSAADTFGE